MAEPDYRLDLECERGGRIWENPRILVGQLGDGGTMYSGRVAGSAGPPDPHHVTLTSNCQHLRSPGPRGTPLASKAHCAAGRAGASTGN